MSLKRKQDEFWRGVHVVKEVLFVLCCLWHVHMPCGKLKKTQMDSKHRDQWLSRVDFHIAPLGAIKRVLSSACEMASCCSWSQCMYKIKFCNFLSLKYIYSYRKKYKFYKHNKCCKLSNKWLVFGTLTGFTVLFWLLPEIMVTVKILLFSSMVS